MVSTEKHLWFNLTVIKERDKVFLLDAPVSPSSIFGESVNMVVSRYREAKRRKFLFIFFPAVLKARGCRQPNMVQLLYEEKPQSRVWHIMHPSGETRRAAHHAQQPKMKPDLRLVIFAKKKP